MSGKNWKNKVLRLMMLKMAEKLAKSQALMSSNDLKTLGIDEAKIPRIIVKRTKTIYRITCLKGTLISKSRLLEIAPI